MISAGVFSGCKKDDQIKEGVRSVQNLKSLDVNSLGMVFFEDFEAVVNALDEVLAMDYIERAVFEDEHGYSSYGRQCDDIYYPSVELEEDDGGFQTEEDIENFVSLHNAYVQLKEDSDGESLYVPHLFTSPYRYFINNDKIFQVGEMYVKVFESGIVTTETENLEVLKQLTEEGLSSIEEDGLFNYSPYMSLTENSHKVYVSGNYFFNEKRNSSDNERIRIESKVASAVTTYRGRNDAKASYYILNSVKPFHKVCRSWCMAKRTVKYDLTLKYTCNDFSANSQGYLSRTDFKAYTGNNTTYGYDVVGGIILNFLLPNKNNAYRAYTFKEISGYVSIPAARCNF